MYGYWNLIFKLLVSATFGGIIGLERQIQGQSAGFRTQLLVCLGSCLFTILSILAYSEFGKIADPARISAQIITGIGFLGAGAILRHGEYIRGLTTAATLWVVSAIGMAVGFGEYLLGGIATFIVLANLIILKFLETKIPRDRYVNITFQIVDTDETDFYALANASNVEIVGRSFKYNIQEGIKDYTLNVRYKRESELNDFMKKLKEIKNIMFLMLN